MLNHRYIEMLRWLYKNATMRVRLQNQNLKPTAERCEIGICDTSEIVHNCDGRCPQDFGLERL